MNGSNFIITNRWNRLHLYHQLEDATDALGEYTNETKNTYHENFFQELASQWKFGQMIPFIKGSFQNKKTEDLVNLTLFPLGPPLPTQIVKNIIVKIGPYSRYPPSQ